MVTKEGDSWVIVVACDNDRKWWLVLVEKQL